MSRTTRYAILLWLGGVTVAVAILLWRVSGAAGAKPPGRVTFDQIDVHRINVIEPDGKPRIILSNAERYPGAYFDGVEYPHPGRLPGGVLFFNDDGTEAGGISYAGRKRPDGGHEAGAMLSMDQYNQNETMKLVYEEVNGRRGAGLVVLGDHPDRSLQELVAASAAVDKATTPADKQTAKARLAEVERATIGDAQSQRAFIGREGDTAHMTLYDKRGDPRLVLKVGADGEPSLELLDAAGKVAHRFPPSS